MEADIYLSCDCKTPMTLENELDFLKYKYRAIFNDASSYYIITDKKLNIVDFNAGASKFINAISSEQIATGANVMQYLKPELHAFVVQQFNNACKGIHGFSECKIELFQRRLTWFSIEYSPAYDNEHCVAGVIFHIQSINKRKIYEYRIELQSSKLRAISLMQSHDIRGPVCTIKGLLSLVREDSENALADYLPLLEQTVNLLDEKIRNIVECAYEI